MPFGASLGVELKMNPLIETKRLTRTSCGRSRPLFMSSAERTRMNRKHGDRGITDLAAAAGSLERSAPPYAEHGLAVAYGPKRRLVRLSASGLVRREDLDAARHRYAMPAIR